MGRKEKKKKENYWVKMFFSHSPNDTTLPVTVDRSVAASALVCLIMGSFISFYLLKRGKGDKGCSTHAVNCVSNKRRTWSHTDKAYVIIKLFKW